MKFKNFIFIHIPKTGGNNIQKMLAATGEYDGTFLATGSRDLINRFEVRDDITHIKHQTCQEYSTKVDLEKFVVFVVMRDPIKRLLSDFFSPGRHHVIRFSGLTYLQKFGINHHLFYRKKDPIFDLEKFKLFVDESPLQIDFLKVDGHVYKKLNIINFSNYNEGLRDFFERNNLKFSNTITNQRIHKYDYQDLIE